MTLNESEAAVISEMARRVIAGHSFKEVAFWANAQGYHTTTGKIFYPLTVRNLLHKKRYAGIREHNGAEYPAVWEPVFDAETWERLQLTLRVRHDRNGYGQDGPKARKYLLTGLVYCGRCGWPLLSAYRYAVRNRADLLDADVRWTKDGPDPDSVGTIIVLHDATLDRITNCEGPISE